MDSQNFEYYLDQIQLQRNARRWWAKAIVTCAVLGGVYGATLGVTIGAVPGAAAIIEIAAAAFAFLCSGPGAWYGSIFGIVNRIRFGRYYVGMVAAIFGAIVGGFLATMLLMALGAISGAVVGWFVARAIARTPSARLLGGLAGVVLGTFVGVVLWAINLNRAGAFLGMAWGGGIGAVVGPLLLLMFIGMLNRLPPMQGGRRRTFIDATFHRED